MISSRVRVLDMPVDAVDMDRAMLFVDDALRGGARRQVILAMNPEKVFALERAPAVKAVFEEAALVIPDGIGVVLGVRLLHRMPVQRVPGADLMHRLCALAALRGYRVFLFGAREEVSAAAASRLEQLYPGLSLAGRANGYVSEEEMAGLVARINEARPDLLFVALGSPKQELWLLHWLPELDVGVCQGVGGTLDTIAGTVRRAPALFRRIGLEWLYRLVREPARIRRQQLLPLFAARVVAARLRKDR